MKTKIYRLVVLFLMVFVGDDAKAQTNVSGFISANTTWNLAGSPYIVVGNALLSHGYTLTIEPGVVVKFNTDKALQIDGELIAIGTPQNRITFTSNQVSPAAGDWAKIHFPDTCVDAVFDANGNYLSGSIMKYSDVLYGGSLGFGEIHIENSSPYFSHCNILNSSFAGIHCTGSTYILDSSSVKNCMVHGLFFDLTAGLNLPCSLIIQTDTFENNQGGIFLSGSLCLNGLCKISNNYFLSNSLRGTLSAHFGPNMIISENLFMNNSTQNGQGIVGLAAIATTECNRFINNNTVNSGVINSDGTQISGRISHNVFDGNTSSSYVSVISLYISEYDTLFFTDNIIKNNTTSSGSCCIFFPPLPTNNQFLHVEHNDFTNNTGQNVIKIDELFGSTNVSNNSVFMKYNNFSNPASQYEIYNNVSYGSQNIYLDNNYWGGTSTQHIDSVIYDYFDFANQSVVYYSPILTSPVVIDSTCASLPTAIISIEKSTNNISIYPNPATNQLHVALTKPITKNTTLTITDMQGRVVKEHPLSLGEGAGGEVIDISTFSQGIYLLKLNGQVQRFVKM